MAIFDKLDQQADYSSNVTTIAAGTFLTGAIKIECELHIDGEVEGEIISTNVVRIGKTGKVKSELRAKELAISGKFEGNADCDAIALLAGADVEGKMITGSLAIDGESVFQGESIHKPADANSKAGIIDKKFGLDKKHNADFHKKEVLFNVSDDSNNGDKKK